MFLIVVVDRWSRRYGLCAFTLATWCTALITKSQLSSPFIAAATFEVVTRACPLVSLTPKGNLIKTGDLSKMNPSMMGGGIVSSGMIGRGPRDKLAGTPIMVTKGPNKGVAGVIKDTNGNLARVELLTGNKVISIDKSKLKWQKYVVLSYLTS